MVKTIRFQLQRTLKNREMLASYILLVIWTSFTILKFYSLILEELRLPLVGGIPQQLSLTNRTLGVSLLLFTFFLFFSYEASAKVVTSHLLEPVSALRRGRLKIFFAIFISNVILLLAVVTIQLGINIHYLNHLAVNDLPIRAHVVLSILFNNFVLPCIAIIMGITAVLIKNRMRAYLLLIGITFLISPFSRWLSYTIDSVSFGISEIIMPLFDVFNLLPPSLDAQPNSVFGFSLLPYRIALAAIWFFGFTTVLLTFLVRKRNRRTSWLRFISLILTVVSIVIFLQPSSIVSFARGHRDTVMADSLYYQNHSAKESLPDFVITSVDLNLRVGQMVHAVASISVEPSALSAYRFTLYHNYKVNRVTTTDNIELSFEQESDYLSILNPERLMLDTLIIEYAGVSNRFFATVQGTYLPGFFCYYPRAGFHPVYDSKHEFIPLYESSPVQYNVNIKSNLAFFCNLPKTGYNRFSGRSNGLSLVSGFFREAEVGDIRLILPSIEWKDNALSSNWQSLIEQGVNRNIITPDIETIFVVDPLRASSMAERMSEYSDHLIVQSLPELFEFYALQKLPYYKQDLFSLIEDEEKHPGEIEMRAIASGWDPTGKNYADEDPIITTESSYSFLADLFEEKGKANVLDACRDYFIDDNDTLSETEFLLSLYDEIPNLSPQERFERDQQLLRAVINETDESRGQIEEAVSYIRSTAAGHDEESRSFEPFRISAQHLLDFDLRVLVLDVLAAQGEAMGRQSIEKLLTTPFRGDTIRDLLRVLRNSQ